MHYFYDLYLTAGEGKDELLRIARRKGFTNPGPIVAFPPNAAVFRNGVTLPTGSRVRLFVPWRPDLLRKMIATMKHLEREVAADARKLIAETAHSKRELEDYLIKIDSLCMLANIGRGITSLVVEGLKGNEMTSEELVSWFLEDRIDVGKDVATLAIPSPERPKRDFKFFIRHTLGPWTPSYWVTVIAAFKYHDSNIFLYGPAAVQWQTQQRIKSQADADIGRLQKKIAAARHQLAMNFYHFRV